MEINGIRFYDGDIKDLPIARYNLLNAMLLNDMGVGNDMEAVNAHLVKLIRFAAAKDDASITTESNNLILCYYSQLNKLSFKSRSLAALVREIDGASYGAAITEADLNEIAGIVETRLSVREAENALTEVKKKFETAWNFTFQANTTTFTKKNTT